MKLSARNQLKGKVLRVTKGAVNAEVTLEIEGGARVTAIITNSSGRKSRTCRGGKRLRRYQGLERDGGRGLERYGKRHRLTAGSENQTVPCTLSGGQRLLYLPYPPGHIIDPKLEGVQNPELKVVELLLRVNHPDDLDGDKQHAHLDGDEGGQEVGGNLEYEENQGLYLKSRC